MIRLSFIFCFILLFITCTSNKNEEQSSKIDDYIVQAFLNDSGKYSKLFSMGLDYLESNMEKIADSTVYGVKISKYLITPDCGGCDHYRLISLEGKMKLSIPVNFEYWLQSYRGFYKDSTSFEDEVVLDSYIQEITLFASSLNAFLSREFQDNNEESIKFSKHLINNFVFNQDIQITSVEGRSKLNDYGFSNKEIDSDNTSFYLLNGVFIKIDWNSSVVDRTVSLEVINPEMFSKVRY